MALRNYGAGDTNLVINGIPLDEFGDTDPPITVEDIEAPSQLKRGIGGTSLRMDNQTQPKRLTVNLLPGSDQARQLEALIRSGVDIQFTLTVNGSPEKETGFDGVADNRGNRGRGGKSSVSDEQFVFQFADGDRA